MTTKKKTSRSKKTRAKLPERSFFGQCTPEEREACTACDALGKRLCAQASYDRLKGPRWGGPKDKRNSTSMVHEAIRWNLGAHYSHLFQTYIVILSWTLDYTNLANEGRLNLADLARIRNVSYDSFLKNHIDPLCCLDLIQKYEQYHLREDRRDEKGFTVYASSPLPAWVIENIFLLESLRKARGKTAIAKATAALKNQQEAVIAKMQGELKTGKKTKPVQVRIKKPKEKRKMI